MRSLSYISALIGGILWLALEDTETEISLGGGAEALEACVILNLRLIFGHRYNKPLLVFCVPNNLDLSIWLALDQMLDRH